MAAGLLVLLGVGLFIAGLGTGATAYFWGCVAVCAVAAVLLVLARRQMAGRPGAGRDQRAAMPAGAVAAAASTDAAAPAATEAARRADDGPASDGPASDGRVGTGSASDGRVGTGPAVAEPADGEPATPVAAGAPSATDAVPAVLADGAAGAPSTGGEPPVEEVEVTDLLLIVDLQDEVLVVDEHPRYHLPGCPHLAGQETFPLPLDEARTDGFTPCGVCAPDRTLAEQVRARRGTQTD
jgi:hypothetical protein